jgi:uncharacterized protein YerC
MPHISSKKLNPVLSDELLHEFVRYVRKGSRANATAFLNSLLTATEQVMLAKRIAAIAMLHDGCSVYRIAQSLTMSTSTISRMHDAHKQGAYAPVTKVMKMNKQEREEFWKLIEKILRAGMPSRGKDRWKWLDEYYPHK